MDLVNNKGVEEGQAFLSSDRSSEEVRWQLSEKQPEKRKATWYLRLVLEIAMAITIVVLLAGEPYRKDTIRRTPVPRCM